jgi:purine-binding chemotaxis protein CheW
MSAANQGGSRASFDWSKIKRRMADVAAVLERSAAPVGEAKAAILKARAKVLAREPLHQDHRAYEQLEVIEFALAYERYALEVAYVREVHSLKEITALPGTPAFVAGIVNVRGQIVSVIDLKRLFQLPDKGLTDLNKVIILSNGHMEFGLLVDAIVGVHRVPLRDIQAPLPTASGARAGYVQGVTAQRVSVLDAQKILADPAIAVRAAP